MAARQHSGTDKTPTVADVRVRTTFTLPRELHQRIRVRAIEQGVTMESLIEAALLDRLNAEAPR